MRSVVLKETGSTDTWTQTEKAALFFSAEMPHAV